MSSEPVLLIDADACPVTGLAIRIARKAGLRVLLVCDTSHEMSRKGAETIVVDKGADSADFALISRVHTGDIVITQDYGVAAMALAKGAHCLSQNGLVYTGANIDSLLEQRHMAKRIRRGGGRLKGPAARMAQQDADFVAALERIIKEIKNI